MTSGSFWNSPGGGRVIQGPVFDLFGPPELDNERYWQDEISDEGMPGSAEDPEYPIIFGPHHGIGPGGPGVPPPTGPPVVGPSGTDDIAFQCAGLRVGAGAHKLRLRQISDRNDFTLERGWFYLKPTGRRRC